MPKKSMKQEGKIALAIDAFKNNKVASLRKASRFFDVPRTTLRDRLSIDQNSTKKGLVNSKLTQDKEKALVNHLLNFDTRGLPARLSMV